MSSLTTPNRPGDMFAPHARNVTIAVVLTPIERDMTRRALTHAALDHSEKGLDATKADLTRLRAQIENPDGSVPFESRPGVADVDALVFHIEGRDIFNIKNALRQYALDNGSNVHEGFGDRETHVADAAWNLGTDLGEVYDRLKNAWGNE